jgi:hypothetical protein
MQVIKDTQHAVLLRTFEVEGSFHLAVSVALFFDCDQPAALLEEKELWTTAAEALGPHGILDSGIPKPCAEYLVAGSCHAPAGAVQQASQVCVRVGGLAKTLDVFGDRYWKKGFAGGCSISEPRAFSEMPLTWQNGFGGPGFAANPLGKGFAELTDKSGVSVRLLPNVEWPDRLIASPGDRPPPAGFGTIGPDWLQRRPKMGTFDERWFKNRWPYFPKDMDYRFYNEASEDQQQDAFWRGDEEILITNMHPVQRAIRSALPGRRVRCLVTIAGTDRDQSALVHDLGMRADTVWLFPSVNRAAIFWRGTVAVADDEGTAVGRVFVADEELTDAPHTTAHWMEQERLKLETAVDGEASAVMADAEKQLAAASALFAAVPRMVAQAKEQAQGLSPSLPASLPGLFSGGAAQIKAGAAMLAGAATSLASVKQEFGHLVKIDLAPLQQGASAMEQASVSLAQAGAQAVDAQAKIAESAKQALQQARQALSSPKVKAQLQRAKVPLNVDAVLAGPFAGTELPLWQQQANALAGASVEALTPDSAVNGALESLGVPKDVARFASLGWRDTPVEFDAVAWGLDAPKPGTAPLSVPKGLMIPQLGGDAVERITVLPLDASGKAAAAPFVVPGSAPRAYHVGLHGQQTFVIAAHELDALVVFAAAWDFCRAVVLDNEAIDQAPFAGEMAASPLIQVVVDKKDPKWSERFDAWRETFPQAQAIALPDGKDVVTARLKGVDIRAWLLGGLRACGIDAVAQRAMPAVSAQPGAAGAQTPGGQPSGKDTPASSTAALLAALDPTELSAQVLGAARSSAEARRVAAAVQRGEPLPSPNPFADLSAKDAVARSKKKLADQKQLTPERERRIDEGAASIEGVARGAERLWELIDKPQAWPPAGNEPLIMPPNPFKKLNPAADIARVKEKLQSNNLLTPERAATIDRGGASIQSIAAGATARYDEAAAMVEDATKAAQDPLPEWAKEMLRKNGFSI